MLCTNAINCLDYTVTNKKKSEFDFILVYKNKKKRKENFKKSETKFHVVHCWPTDRKKKKNLFISVWKVFSCVCYWIWWFWFLNIDFEWMCNLYICVAWVHVWIYQCYRPNFKHSFTSSANLIIIQKKKKERKNTERNFFFPFTNELLRQTVTRFEKSSMWQSGI